MKIRISRDRLEEGVESVRATREAVGKDFDLMVDLNQMWRMSGDIEPALELAKVHRLAAQLAELDV
ncbi:enolase C-terminal domain-like protein, partial [Paraburkholderia sp. SIMBA_027]